MTSEDTHGVTIIAESAAREYLALFVVPWFIGSAVVVSVPATRVTHVRVAAIVILVAVGIGGCFRGWRMGLRIDASGVTIRNFFRTHRIGWREVARFADGSVLSLVARGNEPYAICWALRVVLRDERQAVAAGLADHRGAGAEGGR